MTDNALVVTPDRSGETVVTTSDGRALRAACAGAGTGLSPIELLQAALGACLAASLTPVLSRHGADVAALRITVAGAIASASGGMTVRIVLPVCDDAVRVRCVRAAQSCPVLRALNVPVDICWQV